MLTKTYKYFNQQTRQALLDHVNGYVDKSRSITSEINRLKAKFEIDKIHRFDLGENVDGFSPKIKELIEDMQLGQVMFSKINEYPNVTHRGLRKELAEHHKIRQEQIVISTGLDSIIDLVTRVFFENNDNYLMTIPDFFLFENYSERMGATPLFLTLEEADDFAWTKETLNNYCDSVTRFKPKIVWFSNPSNPSGQIIPPDYLKQILDVAYKNNVFIVIDEAYGEYIDQQFSAISYINNYDNLMVLRTFSKAYGLAGIRLGYLMSSSQDIIHALLIHRHHFPATQLALNFASKALNDQNFIEQTKLRNNRRRNLLFQKLTTLETFKAIPSKTNLFMLKNNCLPDEKLHQLLKQKGIFTSLINITGLKSNKYLRLTVRNNKDNEALFQACKEIEEDILQSVKLDKFSLNYI